MSLVYVSRSLTLHVLDLNNIYEQVVSIIYNDRVYEKFPRKESEAKHLWRLS